MDEVQGKKNSILFFMTGRHPLHINMPLGNSVALGNLSRDKFLFLGDKWKHGGRHAAPLARSLPLL